MMVVVELAGRGRVGLSVSFEFEVAVLAVVLTKTHIKLCFVFFDLHCNVSLVF
jgi:hypothetical protein